MSKRTSESRKLRRGLRKTDKELYDVMTALHPDGEKPSEQELTMQMYEVVLRRMVELRIGQWMHTVLTILRDQFGFDEKQLTQFGQQLRRQTDVSREAKAEVEDKDPS